MISPNLTIAPSSDTERVQIGYDVAGKYYTLTQCRSVVQEGVHIQADKRLILTIEQAEKLRDDLNKFFGYHERT